MELALELRKLIKASHSALAAFQQDVSLVTAGIRLAYLIDVFTLQPCQLARLQQLLNGNGPSSTRIFFFHETDSEQTFAINAELLTRLFSKNGHHQPARPIIYIDLASGQAQTGPAWSTERIMQSLRQAAASCLSIQGADFTQESNCIISLKKYMALSSDKMPAPSTADSSEFMTMLAGILLEYPFVYTTSQSPSARRSVHHLDGKSLVLVKLLLVFSPTQSSQAVIQFSVPLNFKESNEKRFTSALLETKKMYQNRLRQSESFATQQAKTPELACEVKTVMLDQVAL